MSKTYIIAEAGVNHNGSLELALKLVEEAAKAGADAVKFQTFKSENVISKKAEKADYQKSTTDISETQLEMVKKLELSYEEFVIIAEHCIKNNIIFLSTGFDNESLDFLNEVLDIPWIKIPSGEVTNAPLILKAAQTHKNILLSTGMCTIEDIHNTMSIIYYGYTRNSTPANFEEVKRIYETENKDILKEKVTILQCTTEYPTPIEDLNLKSIQFLSDTFGTKVGLSDHSEGIIAPSIAVALGATVIEKHFTLDKNMEGPDHKASITPSELRQLVEMIRYTEKALGCNDKNVAFSEKNNIRIARKSLVAANDIKESEIFTEHNLAIKRPAEGITPLLYWDLIGREAKKNYGKDDLI
ncbi:N-acetylneuraminate synthase [Lysinibacillus sp. G01H]|uniref:N-acetylneuraminate synthase n=1 Tax=Lysinibacillus sp. G01H TaxID=3026425 RepID=UPI00237EC95E|nr:N-acetylneuraminate synthase [Lysinibacillus sp. G01H]WDU80203.1 N-acetylneuraminate synthase [Lysinibacillus sp. G01H]WHP39937.1 N-acetylneuraminate synthase [Lysinibacillus boronitolerans]